jgi:hypothetical protein
MMGTKERNFAPLIHVSLEEVVPAVLSELKPYLGREAIFW